MKSGNLVSYTQGLIININIYIDLKFNSNNNPVDLWITAKSTEYRVQMKQNNAV